MSAASGAYNPWAEAFGRRGHGRDGHTHRGRRHHDHHHDHDHHDHGRGQAMAMDAGRGHGPQDFGFGFPDFGRGFAEFARGFGGWGPRGPRGPRRPRVGRGDVRAGILLLLAEEPRNGYQIIQELEQRSGGVWRPSPGSIYPALAQLEDEGLVEQVGGEGESRRRFRLTSDGTTYVESHRDELKAPWDAVTDSVRGGAFELRDLLGQTAFAAIQVARAGTDEQVAAAKTLLDETRRGLYRILADDPAAETPADQTD